MTSRDTDGGWAWMVLFAAYMNLMIGPGLAFVCGIFQTEFLEHFQESVALTSWVTSLFASLLQLAGPVASIVASQFSCRVSVMVGGSLLSVGLAASSFADDIYVLLVFMGVISGIGLGLTYTPSVIIVNLYFVKRRTFVTGLALSATGAGILIFPMLCRYLLDTRSWRETMCILAAISFQMVVSGALMFPIHEKNNTNICEKLCRLHCVDRRYDARDLTDEQTTAIHEGPSLYQSEHLIQLPQTTSHNEEPSKTLSRNTLNQKPIYLNISFLILCFSLFLSNAAFGIFAVHFPSFALHFGVTPSEVAFALAMNGPALTVSRMVIGAMGNDSKIDPFSIYVGLTAISAMWIFFVPLFSVTAARQCITMVVMGIYFGGSYSLLTVLTIDCVGLDKLVTAFGWEMVFAGSGYLVAPPIAGLIIDTTGLYSRSFKLSGMLLLFSTLTLLLIPVLSTGHVQDSRRRHSNQSIVVDTLATQDNI